MEPNYYTVKNHNSGQYNIHYDKNYRLIVDKDTLYLLNDKDSIKYINTKIISDSNQYILDNVFLLNKALAKRGYPSINKILHLKTSDKVHLSCEA